MRRATGVVLHRLMQSSDPLLLNTAACSTSGYVMTRNFASGLDCISRECPSLLSARGGWQLKTRESPHDNGLAAHVRLMSGLLKSGIPGPRHDVMEANSTHHGGHTLRTINSTETLLALDDVLYDARHVLAPIHIAAACIQLERLHRRSKTSQTPMAFKVQKIGSQLAGLAEERAPRLTVSQVACILRGLSNVHVQLSQELLGCFAAVLIANNCQRLSFGSDQDLRDLAYGFAVQRYCNRAFWQDFCDYITPRVADIEPNLLAGIINAASRAAYHHPQLSVAAAAQLASDRSAAALQPGSVVDIVYAAATLVFDSEALMQRMLQLVSRDLGIYTGKQLSLLISNLSRLRYMDLDLAQRFAAAAMQPNALETMGGLMHVARLVQTLANVGVHNAVLMAELAVRACPLVQAHSTSPQQIINVSRAFELVHRQLRARQALSNDNTTAVAQQAALQVLKAVKQRVRAGSANYLRLTPVQQDCLDTILKRAAQGGSLATNLQIAPIDDASAAAINTI